jgi:putative endonuclease
MESEPGAHIYMLRCSDGSYYVGSARLGLERRLSEHNNGTYGGYTSKRLPVVLVWSEHFLNIADAIAVERQIKGWSRSKKEALIRGDYELLRLLAKRSG